jgi:peptidoglycan-N-acetylglucosamine deacetylase
MKRVPLVYVEKEKIMSKRIRVCFSLILLVLWLSACGTASPTAPTSTPQSVPPTQAAPIVSLVPTKVPPTAVPSTISQPALAGLYPIGQYGITVQVAADGKAVLHTPATRILKAADWQGIWTAHDQGAVITITAEADGSPLPNQPALKVGVVSDTLQVTAFGVDGEFYDRAEWGFALTNGLQHPQVSVLNQLLAQVPYLNYTLPVTDTDRYTELVRRAVARFQETEGLVSSGVATPDTWLHLLSGDYANVPSTAVEFQVTQDAVNIRSGPGTNYTTLDKRYKNDVMDVTGKFSSSTDQVPWLQVCCIGSNRGWVRSDLGQLRRGALDQVAAIPADQLPPTPTAAPLAAAPGGTSSRARAGHPLLADLPSRTADGRPIAYITFDDGPNGSYTQQMLDLLKQYNAHATFCVVGNAVARGKDLMRAEAADRHYICDHTWDHTSLGGIAQDKFIQQVNSTRQAILQTAGDLFTLDKDVRILRPPYGATDGNTRQYAADQGFDVLMWDVDPQDWARPGVDAIVKNVLTYTFPGAVILMHDGGGERSQSVAALRQVLQALSQQRYVFYNIYGN